MAWSILTSCLYIKGLSEMLAPPDPKDPNTLVFLAPLGDGAYPLIYLKDYGSYARWMLDTPSKSNSIQFVRHN